MNRACAWLLLALAACDGAFSADVDAGDGDRQPNVPTSAELELDAGDVEASGDAGDAAIDAGDVAIARPDVATMDAGAETEASDAVADVDAADARACLVVNMTVCAVPGYPYLAHCEGLVCCCATP